MRIFAKRQKERFKRILAAYLAICILFDVVFPTAAFALTGGPSQPEVQSFEPVGTSNMVDMFSGDFNYNIPLMDVGGYPINIAYHSGIGMDQEASWTGLGWNINPGVINRNMRGIPDDFDGDMIEKKFNMKPNKTIGASVGAGIELAGAEKLKVGIAYSIGIRYNNYSGFGVEKSLNLSISASLGSNGGLSGGLGITSSSDDGLTLQPSVSFSAKTGKSDSKASAGLGLSVGTAYNSRGGLKSLTVSANMSVSANRDGKTVKKDGSTKKDYGSGGASGSQGGSASFDFGQPTYSPMVQMSMQNLSVTGNFKIGFEAYTLHPNFTVGGYYSCQELIAKSQNNPAFGYMFAHEGTKYDNAIMDFNREKDGNFNESTPALPLANFTYDMFTVAGQGVGGSYRTFRSDVGHVFDANNFSTSDGYAIGAEVGIGNLVHVGVDVSVNNTDTRSNKWADGNQAADALTHKESGNNSLYESSYFKEANEKSVDSDPNFIDNIGGYEPQRFELKQQSKFNTIATNNFVNRYGNKKAIGTNQRASREKRNQVFSYLTRAEIGQFGIANYNNLYTPSPSYKIDHHIAEITNLGMDGSRYVYGIAAYNTLQKEVTFAVNGSGDPLTGLVPYSPGSDNSTGNTKGQDNFYSSTTTPPFAHSYLLTSVLSADYVDSDGNRGPTDGDLGNYTYFKYKKVSGYNWRIPIEKNKATANPGLMTDDEDDKANYLYGSKELSFLDTIVTKNYIGVFYKSAREDALGAIDEDGGGNTAVRNLKLDSIKLFVKREYYSNPTNAKALKTVHLVYDYSLCPKVENRVGGANALLGKLTLREIYFTYQGSSKGRFSAYKFDYGTLNPSYNIKGYDRWGNYKPVTTTPQGSSNPINTTDFPYVDQNRIVADQFASAWTLDKITLPSGGTINIKYEADDYAYVQNRRANRMFMLNGLGVPNGTSLSPNSNEVLIFEGVKGYNNPNDYGSVGQLMYFRCLMNFFNSHQEYVSGYARIKTLQVTPGVGSAPPMVKVTLNPESDLNMPNYNPITKAGIQYVRLNRPRWAFGNNTTGDQALGKQLLESWMNSSFIKNMIDAAKGPNKAVYDHGNANSLEIGKSWVRMMEPTMHKLGGGCRIKQIILSDEWNLMTGGLEKFSYGQEYNYTNPDGTSSGVASYEPQLGGDENPWKQPVFFTESKLLAPDDEHYMEEPFGETFFPSPSIGYSRVEVKNLSRKNVKKHATGKVVHEFYTAKDFPTIVERTGVDPRREKTDPFSLKSIFKVDTKDYITASQGFYIELNDMHGKPKSQNVYQEFQTQPISSVEYKYKSTSYANNSSRLDNSVSVIKKDGSVNPASIGVFFDAVGDMREQFNQTNSTTVATNVDVFLAGIYPIVVPMIWPSFTKESIQFRSATYTKIVQRFGILEETVAKDLGSVVSTKNLAYDSETGEVLLTQTTTDFNDAIYSLNYPAHWYYDGMGQAYKNISYKTSLSFNAGVANVSNANSFFAEGDEIALTGSTSMIGWVTNVSSSSISVQNVSGAAVPSGSYGVKVVRSGRRNMQNVSIASMTSLTNPLNNLKSNTFENVLQAEAKEFGNKWRTYCDCFDGGSNSLIQSTNPYVNGTKGNWRLLKSYLHLTDRTQSNYNKNTNIRKDGVFTSYTPFYKVNSNVWNKDDKNWTYTSEVTEFNPIGQEIENKDALGRYSAATFGYNQSLATAVAANSKYSQVGYDNFEDYGFSKCADNHFKFANGITYLNGDAHTGKHSILVSSIQPVTLDRQLQQCDKAECKINYTYTTSNGTINITNATPPLNITWNIVNGAPNVTLTSNGVVISNPVGLTLPWTVELSVIDSKNCSISKTFRKL